MHLDYDGESLSYRPPCLADGCHAAAEFKAAATWTDGVYRELKNYGAACSAHAPMLLEQARRRRAALVLAEGESVGEVGLYRLQSGRRDAELVRLAEALA